MISQIFTGRALQRAAAAAAVERARRARVQQGGAAKGGGGKGKGVEEREEECSICQSEFTVQGDGGEYCSVIVYHWRDGHYFFHIMVHLVMYVLTNNCYLLLLSHTQEWHSAVLHLITCAMNALVFG